MQSVTFSKKFMQNHVSQNSTRNEVSVAFAESIESKRDFFQSNFVQNQIFWKRIPTKGPSFPEKVHPIMIF